MSVEWRQDQATDFRMPRMDGMAFLTRVIPIQPDAPRVIISGFADRDAVIVAINDAQLTRFIEKPWEDAALQQAAVTILTRGMGCCGRATANSEGGLGGQCGESGDSDRAAIARSVGKGPRSRGVLDK